MGRYHFNLTDGSNEPDATGTELPDLHAAQVNAVALAGVIAMERAESVWADGSLQVEVTDPTGVVLLLVTMIVTKSPAAVESCGP